MVVREAREAGGERWGELDQCELSFSQTGARSSGVLVYNGVTTDNVLHFSQSSDKGF
jgi:hypothetical protein